MKKRILLYTMKGCGHCMNLKNKLDKEKIPYINKDIDIYKTDYERVSSLLETEYIPIVRIDNDYLVPEKDFNTIDECVELVKKMI